jgi:Na+/melibiose symporter-like transporter
MEKIMPKNRICYGEHKKSQILFLIDAALINSAHVLTTGVFLSGYVIYLKGSDFLVALLNNSAVWASILTIFSFMILERMKVRKKLLIIINVLSRVLTCGVVFLPLITKSNKNIILLLSIMVILGNFLWGFYRLGYMIWYMEIAPKEKKNDYIYMRMLFLRIANTIAMVLAGYILDYYNKGPTGFLIVFLASLVISLIDAVILLFVEEPEYGKTESIKGNGLKKNVAMFFEPLKNNNYRRFLSFSFLYFLSLTISTSFTSTYLIRYLNLDYGIITTINIIMYLLMIASTKTWGRIQSIKSTVFVLKISALIAIFECFIYFFLTQQTTFVLYFAAIVSGIGYGGFNVAFIAYRFELMPNRGKSLYEGWFNAIDGISVLLAPIIGEIIIRNLGKLEGFSLLGFPISKFQFLYIVSFILIFIVVILSFYKPGIISGQKIDKKNKKSKEAGNEYFYNG